MILRALCVVAALGAAASVAACSGEGGSDGELGAPPVSPAPTSTAAADRATTTAAPPTTAATTTPVQPAPTTQATSTTAPAATLTPELEAELIDVYVAARNVLFQGLLSPREADRQALARYWSPGLTEVWSRLLDDWAANDRHAERGPQELQYADVLSVVLVDPSTARLEACAVSDAAVYDGASGQYIDPGLLASIRKDAELRRVDGRWLVFRDRQVSVTEGVVGCGA